MTTIPIAEQLQNLLIEHPNLDEQDLQFAISQILNGNGRNGNGRADAADYSQEQEIFDRQSPELQEFMLQTAMLPQSEKLPRFCNALLRKDDSEVYLQAVVDKNLDQPAFIEFLRHRVRQDADGYKKLCLKTAKILDKNIRSKESIGLFIQAESWEKATDLIDEFGIEFYDRGQALKLYEWLEQIPDSELDWCPRLLLLKGRILLDDLARYAEAETIFSRAELIFQEQNDMVNIARAVVFRSVCLRMTGQAKDSLKLAKTGLDRLEKLMAVDIHIMAWAIRNRGVAYRVAGRNSESLADLERCLPLFERLKNRYYIAMCHHDIGVALAQQGQINDTLYHYEQAIDIWESLDNQNDLANSLNSLGVSLSLLGQYDEALEKAQAALKIATKINAPRRRAFILETMADIYLGLQEYEQAIEFYEKSIDIAKKAGIKAVKAAAMAKAGECFFYLDDLFKASILAEQARKLASNGLTTEMGMALDLEAKIHVRHGRSSTYIFKKAVGFLEGDRIRQTSSRLWLADMLMQDSKFKAAFEQLRLAVEYILETDLIDSRLLQTVQEKQFLCNFFLHHPHTPPGITDGLSLLLRKSEGRNKNLEVDLDFWMYAMGPPCWIVRGQRYDFNPVGLVAHTPELLFYLICENRRLPGVSKEESCRVLEIPKSNFHQLVRLLRDTFRNEKCDSTVERNGRYYRLIGNYRCDVLVLDYLLIKVNAMSPSKEKLDVWQEIIFLYRGEFLEGHELSPWGEEFRTRLRKEFVETVTQAAEYLLTIDKPEEALEVIKKGLALYPTKKDLRCLETKIKTQLTEQYEKIRKVLCR